MKHKGADRTIEVYWWNFGTKTTDFTGTISEYLKDRDIEVRKAPPKKERVCQEWIFKIRTASSTTTLRIYEQQFHKAAELAILLFLTMMGDKSLFRASRDYKVNWR